MHKVYKFNIKLYAPTFVYVIFTYLFHPFTYESLLLIYFIPKHEHFIMNTKSIYLETFYKSSHAFYFCKLNYVH